MTPDQLTDALNIRIQDLIKASLLELNERMKSLYLRGRIPIRNISIKYDIGGRPLSNVNIYRDNFEVIKRHVCNEMSNAGFDLEMDIEQGMFISYNMSAANSSLFPFLMFSMMLVFLVSVSLYYK